MTTTRTNDPIDRPSEQEQALAVFNHAAEEIRFFKSQQWSVTNYTLLAYAALAAAPEWVATGQVLANLVCASLVIFAGGGALGVLASLEKALIKERNRMAEARSALLPRVESIHSKFPPQQATIALLRVAVILGAALAFWINLSRPGVAAWLPGL